MYSAADLAGKEAVGKVKDFASGIGENLGEKRTSRS